MTARAELDALARVTRIGLPFEELALESRNINQNRGGRGLAREWMQCHDSDLRVFRTTIYANRRRDSTVVVSAFRLRQGFGGPP